MGSPTDGISMEAEFSRTADSSAAQRAIHTMYASAPKIFDDPYALDLGGPRWRRIVNSRALMWLMEHVFFRWIKPMIGLHVVRARYTEDCLHEILPQGLSQYVILGAGMDSFGLRHPELAQDLDIFEVDHPGTQEIKQARMREFRYQVPANLHFVPVDFEKDSLEERLLKADLKRDKKTIFSWLGVLPFLSKAAIEGTLQITAKLAAEGSELVCDVMDERALTPEGQRSICMRKSTQISAKYGEPFVTGLAIDDFTDMLAKVGWQVVEIVRADEQRTRWFDNRADQLVPFDFFYLVRAKRVASE